MQQLSEWAFYYRRLVFMLLLVLLLIGGISFFKLPAQEDPTITIREAVVIVEYPGLSPTRVEDLITKKLERNIRKMPEIESIRSTSLTGRAILHVEIQDQYFNLDNIWQDLRNKVEQTKPELPDGIQRISVNDEFGDVAVFTLALTSSDYPTRLTNDMSKHIRDWLYGVPGTKKIDVLGVQPERIFLEVSNAKLAQLDITPGELITILQGQNIIQPGGAVDTGHKEFIVEPSGNFNSVTDIENTLITLPETDEVIPLSDALTVVRDKIDPPYEPAYFNGESAVVFAISMLEGNNILEYAPRMRNAIQALEATLPIGMHLEIITDQSEQVHQTVYGVSNNVLQTLLIVLAVVIAFLGVRTGLIVGAIVPFVMLITLAIMNFMGMALERMSLATLIIALGLLVDNGIVMAEDFKRRLEKGSDRLAALKHSGQELAVPLFASSITTILVFLPLMLANHVAGEYTRAVSLVIMISLLTSWVLALAITPTLCYYFLPTPQRETTTATKPSRFDAINARYKPLLEWVLRHRRLFMAAMVGLLFVSVGLMRLVPQQFFPDSDRSQILVYLDLPAGTSARTMTERLEAAFPFIEDKTRLPHVESFAAYSGFGGPRFVLSLSPEDPQANKAFIVVNVDDLSHMDETINGLKAIFHNHFPELFARVTRMFLGPSDSSKLEVQIKGPDSEVLYDKALEMADLLRNTEGTTDVRINWENRITNILIAVDQQRARRAAVTSEDIATSMQAYFSGLQVTEFREDEDVIPILIRAQATERFNLDRMRSMNVFSSARRTNVPLFQIADFLPQNQFARIDREDMFRTITVEARSLISTAEDLKAAIDSDIQALGETLPLNHWLEYDGVIEDSVDAQRALSANVPLVLGLIVVVLVAQFNSYRRPLIILLTIPLSFIGAVIGLLLMRAPFGFMVTLGLYSLAGIIINNAIVLIDRIELERAKGLDAMEAILTACQERLRPILMTSITTIVGLLPLMLGQDPLFYGMAVVMAFGLGVGTILTLGVVPVLYAMLFKVPMMRQDN